MFDHEQEIQKAYDNYKKALTTLEAASLLDISSISFCSTDTIFLHPIDRSELPETLHMIKRFLGPYELHYYYISQDLLRVVYKIPSFRIEIVITLSGNTSENLNYISNGRCTAIKYPSTTTEIICSAENKE